MKCASPELYNQIKGVELVDGVQVEEVDDVAVFIDFWSSCRRKYQKTRFHGVTSSKVHFGSCAIKMAHISLMIIIQICFFYFLITYFDCMHALQDQKIAV